MHSLAPGIAGSPGYGVHALVQGMPTSTENVSTSLRPEVFQLLGNSGPLDELLIFDGLEVERHRVQRVTAETIQARGLVIPREQVQTFYARGGRLFVVGMDHPARVAAEEVRALTENAALASLFSPTAGGLNVPWQIWALIGGLLLGVVLG